MTDSELPRIYVGKFRAWLRLARFVFLHPIQAADAYQKGLAGIVQDHYEP